LKVKNVDYILPEWSKSYGEETPLDIKMSLDHGKIWKIEPKLKPSLFNFDAKGNFRWRLNFNLDALIP